MKHERSIRSEPSAERNELNYTIIVAVLAALLIASTNVGHPSSSSLLGGYPYWVVRIVIESALFLLVRDAIERTLVSSQPGWKINGAAILISLVPFVLAITALDIVLGYPELGAENAAADTSSKLKEFGLELLFLLDNHIVLCLLLTVPRMLLAHRGSRHAHAPTVPDQVATSRATIFSDLNPPLKGELLWVEAQEHYVRLTTSEETRMVLMRFADVLRNLADERGLQVHRSHWVSIKAVKEAFRDGANLRLRLQTDNIVPVSRTFRASTERRLKETELMI